MKNPSANDQSGSATSAFASARHGWLCLAVLALSVALLALAGCGRTAEQAPLRIGILVWPPYELAFLARELGYLEGANIVLVDYESPAVVQRAYREGAIDAVAMTSHYLIELASTDSEQRVPLVIDASHGGDVLIARQGIDSLADLKGARIAVESGSLGAYMLLRALDRAGLRLDEVTRVSADIPEHFDKFTSGAVDAVITYEPVRTQLLKHGGHVLFDSSEIPNEILDVLITRASTVESHSQDLEVFVDGWFRALDYLRAHPTQAADRMALREQISSEEFLQALELTELHDQVANQRLLGLPDKALNSILKVQADTMARSGILRAPVDVNGLAEPRFLLRSSQQAP